MCLRLSRVCSPYSSPYSPSLYTSTLLILCDCLRLFNFYADMWYEFDSFPLEKLSSLLSISALLPRLPCLPSPLLYLLLSPFASSCLPLLSNWIRLLLLPVRLPVLVSRRACQACRPCLPAFDKFSWFATPLTPLQSTFPCGPGQRLSCVIDERCQYVFCH